MKMVGPKMERRVNRKHIGGGTHSPIKEICDHFGVSHNQTRITLRGITHRGVARLPAITKGKEVKIELMPHMNHIQIKSHDGKSSIGGNELIAKVAKGRKGTLHLGLRDGKTYTKFKVTSVERN